MTNPTLATVFLALAAIGPMRAEVAFAQDAATLPAAEATPPVTASVDELIARLGSPDATTRVASVRALGERGSPAAEDPLIQVLRNDPVPEVRGWAVRALYQIGTPEARAAVVTAARSDPDERVRGMGARLTGVASEPPPAPAPSPVPPTPPAYGQPVVLGGYVAPPPPPVRRPRPPGRSLRLGGWITTGVTYGLALLSGAALMSTGDGGMVDWGWKMILPVVGPVVASMTNWEGEEAAMSIWFWLWSAGEATGVILLAVGYVQGARAAQEAAEREDDEEDRYGSRRPAYGWTITPFGPGGPAGLGVTGWW
jgi:hypothetical protein